MRRQEIKLKIRPVAMLSPLCLCLFAGSARADLEPFTLGASESIEHQSNVFHNDTVRTADWLSITELNAGLSQPLGRDKLVASAAVDYNRYKHSRDLDATGYRAAGQFDWSTIGDLSGSLGADSSRRQYVYGETAEVLPGTTPVIINGRNLQTDNHAFARLQLGGVSRWTINGGADVSERNYSNPAFAASEERQWAGNLGTSYATSPDLSFGVVGYYTNGKYPHGSLDGTSSNFTTKTFSLTSKWQASGNSSLNSSLGYTIENNEILGGSRNFVSGSLGWNWTPPSHFGVSLSLKRSSDADSTGGANAAILNANQLTGIAINNEAYLDVTYALTAKISLDANADYSVRKYADIRQPTPPDLSGSTRTARLYLTAHYQPTRTTDLSCGGGREIRKIDATLVGITPAYTDTYVQCVASIHFD